jgi:hypothetical protein
VIIVVEGTKSFDDYDVFMRAMGVALSISNNETEIQVWSIGPHKVNSFTAAFCNSSENFLKQKGFKISFSKVHPSWIEENLHYVNYYAFFSSPKESLSRLAKKAQEIESCELGIFRY